MAHRFRAFIETERDRFGTPHDPRNNNLFAAAFNDVWIYRWFLDVIAGRNAPLGRQYKELSDAHWGEVSKSSGGRATGELMRIHALMSQAGLLARLEIESFYLLAGVLLERVATALGFYFEGRTDNEWRHAGMQSKPFGEYAASHGLELPHRFLALADSLKTDVIDFRNEQIVHEGNVRATRGTGLRTAPGFEPQLHISIGALYPTEAEIAEIDSKRADWGSDPVEAMRRERMESRQLPELLALIDDYLASVMELIELNRTASPLTPKS